MLQKKKANQILIGQIQMVFTYILDTAQVRHDIILKFEKQTVLNY